MRSFLQSKKRYFLFALMYTLLLYNITLFELQIHLLAIIVVITIVFIGFKKPLIGLLFSFAAMNSFFDLVPKQLFLETDINKTWDIGFVFMIIFGCPLLFQNYKKIEATPVYLKLFILFFLICVVSFILTVYKYPFPIIDAIRSFRYYLGYLFFPFLLQYLLQAKDGEQALYKLLDILYKVSFVLLVMYNIQFLIQQPLFLGYNATQNTSYGESYIRSIPNFLFICYFFLWFNLSSLFLNRPLYPYGKLNILLCLSATLFTFTRGIYISVVLIIVLISLIILFSKKRNITKMLISGLLGILLLMTLFITGHLNPFIDRASTINRSTLSAQQQGTLWYRILLLEDRIKLIKNENPILGLGFIHNRHGYKFGTFSGNYDESIGGPGLGCSDIAWGNIIYQTGWLGFWIFSIFTISTIYYICVILRQKIIALPTNKIDKLFLIEFASLLELLRLIIHTMNSDAFTGNTQNPSLIFAFAAYTYILQRRSNKENMKI